MQIDTKRAQRLQAFLATATPETNTQQFIELNGKREPYKVYRIPLELLIFNIRNGRFAAELIAKEKAVGKKLDAIKVDDAKMIRQLLLDQDSNETEILTEDLKKNGQTDPGIVTFDGAVINANRRFAIFSKLYEETSAPRYKFLTASVLPRNVDEKDLWRIEAGLQFAKDFRLEYGPINELLKLKEGVGRGLSAKEISQSLLGRYSDKGVKDRLEVLKHIETYRSGSGCLNNFPRFISGFRAGCKVQSCPRRRASLATNDRRGGQLGVHHEIHLTRPAPRAAAQPGTSHPA